MKCDLLGSRRIVGDSEKYYLVDIDEISNLHQFVTVVHELSLHPLDQLCSRHQLTNVP